ncbi:MAG: AAA family ATPase [bacterium]|nr:AAA family ATPase [bacterium]
MSFEINEQFARAIEILENTNKHTFITGKAGTGKSTLLTYFRGITKKHHIVLASTGAAAVNINGQTVHSFFHFTPQITLDEAAKLGKSNKNTKLYQKLQLIIIDEVSMIRSDLFDCVDLFLKSARLSNEPFGGVQMALFGDLYQLPPVINKDEIDIFSQLYESPFFFDSNAFVRISQFEDFYELIELKKMYRQSDEDFIDLLNNVRNKQTNHSNLEMLNKQLSKMVEDTSEYIYLVSTNKQAEEINKISLNKLTTKLESYTGVMYGDFENRNVPTEIELSLRIGARVMFLNNDADNRWINGTLGEVVGLYHDESNSNLPVIEVKKDDNETVEVYPYTWTNYKSSLNDKTGKIEKDAVGTYTQIPLKLAWAITIHKSQGKTFDKVIIDIGWGTFASGQLYVALSRCKTLDGIILKKPIQHKHILLDPRVVSFFNPNI